MSRSLRVITLGLVAAVLLTVGLTAAQYLLFGGRVLPRVRLAGVHVAGRTRGEVGTAIARRASVLEREPLRIRARGHRFVLDPTTIRLRVDTTRTFLAVRDTGHGANPVADLVGTVGRLFHPTSVDWRVTYDSALLDADVARWAKTVGTTAVEGHITVAGVTVTATHPSPGVALALKPAADRVRDALRSGSTGPINLPVHRVEPEVSAAEVEGAAARARSLLTAPVVVTVDGIAVSISPESLGGALRQHVHDHTLELAVDHAALHAALGPAIAKHEVPVRDAGWKTDGESATVIAAQTGHLVDLDTLERAVLAGQQAVTMSLHDVAPTHDTAWADALHITHRVSTFTTEHPAGQPRVLNIHRAADILQDHVVMPGERFSLNRALGPRTEARGFVKAPVIYDDEFTEDVGGGVSQFATTLYNAVFFGGYKIVFHQAHSFYISRYPMGREATVSTPAPDLVFDNDSAAGILVRTAYNRTSITVSFYGDNGGRTVTAEGPTVLKTVDAGTDFIDDPTLPAGTEKEIDHAFAGYEVAVVRVISTPGQEPTRQRIFTRYRVHNRKVARGTGPGSSTSTSATSTTRPPAAVTTTTHR